MKIGPSISSLPATTVPRAQAPSADAAPAVAEDRIHWTQAIRFARDAGSVLSDVKTVGTCLANVITLPAGLQHYLGATNAGGLIGGVVGLGFDLYGTKKVFDNPSSTRKDKVVDIAHIAISDVLGTACGAIPLFASLHNPIAMTCFIGGQALGVATDIYKISYDIKHRGKQGVFRALEVPVAATPTLGAAPPAI